MYVVMIAEGLVQAIHFVLSLWMTIVQTVLEFLRPQLRVLILTVRSILQLLGRVERSQKEVLDDLQQVYSVQATMEWTASCIFIWLLARLLRSKYNQYKATSSPTISSFAIGFRLTVITLGAMILCNRFNALLFTH